MRIRSVPAISRAIKILRLLNEESSLGVQSIARRTEIIPSTCLHILRELVAQSLVSFDAKQKRYSLSPGILALGSSMLQTGSLAHVIKPSLDDLTRRFPISAALMKISAESEMVVICTSNRPGVGLRVVEIGTQLSSFESATGRCVAGNADLSRAALEAQFRKLSWAKPPTFNVWLAQIKEAAARGYGVDKGNYQIGVTVISVPIRDPSLKLVYAVVGIGTNEQISIIGEQKIAAELKSISKMLSGVPQPGAKP